MFSLQVLVLISNSSDLTGVWGGWGHVHNLTCLDLCSDRIERGRERLKGASSVIMLFD